MKINEVVVPLDEVGPIDALRRVGSTLAGAYQGAKTGGIRGAYQGAKGGFQQAKSAEDLRIATNDLFQRWNQEIARQPRNIAPDEASKLLANWANNALSDRDGTQVPEPQMANIGDARKAYDYLYKRAEEYFRTAAVDPSQQPRAAAKPGIPTGYAPPQGYANMNFKGYDYSYDPTKKSWTNDTTNQAITLPAETAVLNSEYHKQLQKAAAGQGPNPNTTGPRPTPAPPAPSPTPTASTAVAPDEEPISIGGQVIKPGDPLYDKIKQQVAAGIQKPQTDAGVELGGKDYGFTISDDSWHDDETGKVITDPTTVQRLNQRYYVLKDLAKVGKAEDPDDPEVFDPRDTIGGNLPPRPTLPPGPSVTDIRTKKKWNPLDDTELNESTLKEGGNAIPEAEPVNKEDVPGVVEHAKKLLPPELLPGLQVDIGSAGFKEVPAGDIDLMIEAEDLAKLYNTLEDKDPVKAAKKALSKYLTERGYSSNVQGRNVHVGIPYTQQATGAKKVAQVDYMAIHEAAIVAPWHQHGPRGMYSDPDFKGNELFMLISSIAKHLNLKFDPFAAKLIHRDTGETVGRTRKEVAKILLGPRAKESDLDSVKSALKALETDPDREGKLAQARQDAAKGLMRLPETAQPGTAAWFRQMSDMVR